MAEDARATQAPRVMLDVGNAMALAAQTSTYDATVARLVLNFVPQA
jgi:hypothetical protein